MNQTESINSPTEYLTISILTAFFPAEPGLAGFIGAKDDGSGGHKWSYKMCKAPVNLSPPAN